MKEIIDEYCWEDHKKVITFDQHGISGLRNIAHWNLSTAAPPSPEHFHSDIIEMHCLIKGKRECHVGDNTYSVTGNELFLTFPYEPHYTSNYNLSPCSFFGFQIDIAEKEHLLGLNKEYSLALHEMLTTFEHRHLRFTPAEQQLLKLAFVNISDGDPGMLRLGVQYLSCFLFKIPEFIPVRQEEKRIPDSNIRRVLDFVELHHKENPRLTELAAISGYSLSRFKIKFKEVVGMPPANYMTLKKLEYAKRLLATTEIPITQIALDAGFSSSNYFCTVMHNYTSYSPGEYRQACSQRLKNQ